MILTNRFLFLVIGNAIIVSHKLLQLKRILSQVWTFVLTSNYQSEKHIPDEETSMRHALSSPSQNINLVGSSGVGGGRRLLL